MTRLRLILPLLALVAGLLLPLAAAQAGPASLIADRVQVLGNDRILAEGNVVVIYGDVRLTASRVLYDRVSDTLTIDGPITLTQSDNTVVLADAAELSTDLREGILQGARFVLDQQLQIAAAEINRVQGRYTQMTKVVASSCQVCVNRPVPLWQIRASRVIHDQVEHQLYFHNAQLRVMDLPIFFLPRLRLPDPTLKRATGFLTPRLRSNSQIGTGIRVPYFIKFGDHADLTLAPFLSAKTVTLEARYRQLFRHGGITFNGAISQDDLRPGETRYYVFGEGQFDLPRDFTLAFNLEQASDEAYLLDYGFSGKDRLNSAVEVTRTRRNEDIHAGIRKYETLRASEIPISDQLPFAQSDMSYERRFQPGILGGEALLLVSAHGHFRESTLDALGRDMSRVGVTLEWRRDWQFRNGLIGQVEGSVAADTYWIAQDAAFAPQQSHVTPAAAVSLRWPLSRTTARGAVDVLEPVAQLAWTNQMGVNVPNEDSLLVEFDEANLFDLSRFPGFDRYERGVRANLGLTWTRYATSGWTFTLAGGKVFRAQDLGQFSAASGLDGLTSDWLIAGQVRFDDRFALQSRALLADDFTVTKAETRAVWDSGKLNLSTAHVWVVADPAENRPVPTHEWALAAAYQVNPGWQLSADWHYDVQAREATKAGLGLEYRNECVTVDLSLSRRFTSSISVTPTTDVGLSITLTGFGGSTGVKSRKCSG